MAWKDYNKLDKRDLHIEKAVDNMIDSWDMSTLMNYAFEEQLEYFLGIADEEEVNELLKEFG